MKININKIVKVKLSKDGIEIYRKRHNGSSPHIDENGFTEFSMWCLMDTFSNIGVGLAPFEDGYVYMNENDLKDDDYDPYDWMKSFFRA